MNNSTLQDWYSIIGIISTFTFLLPILIILWKKLYVNKSLWAFIGFGLITFIYQLFILEIFASTPEFFANFELIYHLLFNPLLLMFLFYFVDNKQLDAAIHKGIVSFVTFEVAVLVIMGVNKKSDALALGLGLLLTLIFTLLVFIRQIRKTVGERTETDKGFAISALLFACCCYIVLFLLTYVVNTTHSDDVYALYNLTSIISNLVITVGLLLTKSKTHPAETNADSRNKLKNIKFPDWDELPLNN